MTNTPTENPIAEVLKKQPETVVATDFTNAFSAIGNEYTQKKKLNVNEARNLVGKQLKELLDLFEKYKVTPRGKELMKQAKDTSISVNPEVMAMQKIEADIQMIQVLIQGTDRKSILQIINLYGGDNENTIHNPILKFLPEEYIQGKVIKENILNEANRMFTLHEMQLFLNGKRESMPHFDNDDYKENGDIINQALEKTHNVSSIIQRMMTYRRKMPELEALAKNTEFIKTINKILAKQYPEFFGVAQKKDWYTKSEPDILKISILLDIIKYRPPERQQDFLDMMNGENNKDGKTPIQVYEEYFQGTEIGNDIDFYFSKSQTLSDIRKRTDEFMDKEIKKQVNTKGGIYDLFQNHEYGKMVLMGSFNRIPINNLNTLLSFLPYIESLCPHGNSQDIIKKIEGDINFKNIDTLYIREFFAGLKNISSLGDERISQKHIDFYSSIETEYTNINEVSREKDELYKNGTEKYGDKLNFKIINNVNFPQSSTEELEEKNQRLKRLLDKFIDDKGCINVAQKDFKNELLEIFKGSSIYEKIKDPKTGGKAALGILVGVAQEKKEHSDNEIKKISKSFNGEKIQILEKEKPEEYKLLRNILNGNEPIDIKIATLQKYEIIGSEKIREEDKAEIISLVKANLISIKQTQATKAILDDSVKLKAFESYYRGEINIDSLNSQIEKREQEIKQQDKKDTTKETLVNPMKSYDNVQSLSAHFSEIPDGEIVIYKDEKDNDVYIKKDSKYEISIFSSGVPIRGIKIKDEKKPQSDIKEAMGSVQFIKDCGLSIFGTSLQKMIDIINNKQRGKGEKQISLADGVEKGGTEEQILLKYIAKMVDIDGSLPIERLREKFREINHNEGLLSRLQRKPGFVTNNSLNMTTIINDLEKVEI